MKAINFLTVAIMLLFGAINSLHAQCNATFSYTNTGNSYNFTALTSGAINPIFEWTINDYNNNTTTNLTTASSTLNHTFNGGSPIGWHYVCLTVYDSLTNCQTMFCDTVYTNTASCANASTGYQYSVSGNSVSFYSYLNGFFPPMTQYTWDFGNNTMSYMANPTTQLSTGWHYVCLTVTDSMCTETYCDTIYVSGNNPCNVSATFSDTTYSGGTGFFPSVSGFQTGATSYYWNFGNGTGSSSQYPVVQLSNGWHYICLTVTDSICTETYCDTIYVGTTSCAGFGVGQSHTLNGNTAMFTSNITAGTAPYTYAWNFHGIGGSSLANPSFTYPGAGWYAVDLTVYDANGCQAFLHDSVYITGVVNPCLQNAVSFNLLFDNYATETSWTVTDGNGIVVANGGNYTSAMNGVNLAIDLCLPTGCYNFNIYDTYGDGICCTQGQGYYTLVDDSTGTTLASGGSFTYSETTNFCVGGASNPCGSASAGYQYTTSGNSVSFYSYLNGFFPPTTQYTWDFGNNTMSYTANPTTQLSTGWHYVCLTVTDSMCTETYCDTIYVSGNNPCNVSATFSDTTYSGGTGFFPSVSGFQTGATSYYWNFGNGTGSSSQYPVVQLSNGWHSICLTVSDSLCQYTYCDSIYINNTITNPCLQNAVSFNLLFDNYATETSWTVTDGNGIVVANGGNYTSAMNGVNLAIDLCLPTGCYNFNIYDTYGDGICCYYGQGNYSLVEAATGLTLASGGSFTYAETTNFCVGGASNPCGNFGNGSFTYTVGANGAVTFTPVNTGAQYPMNYSWDFGNNNGSSSSNPTFTFANGYHLVCVTADSGNCSYTYCDSIMVTTNNGNQNGPCANLTTDINITQDTTNPLILWMQPVVNGAAQGAGFTFVWDFGDNTGAMSGAPSHVYNGFGSYVVCMMALDTLNGCVSTFCDTITVDSSGNFSRNFAKPGFMVNALPPVINFFTSASEVETNGMTINLFPNPAKNVVNLAISSEDAINGTVSILDITGKVAYMNTLNVAAGQAQISLPVEDFPSGVYLVRITSETTQQTMKFIKE
ncbi:MAG: T9SS C-terminal target domain-containing protein [uncultured Aureispira sp.]|uniref:T9SS C-terminal target domain-containing protein n=1 Tax=uncultured Aureispira sp. TaxID=1331704 RepID=A0A6S6S969_9BACT|nr:MAG: T9SS C-terminal target domain-containing protein [uncultured Aureispira sp.]